MRYLKLFSFLVTLLLALTSLGMAGTRKAFVVGIEHYQNISQLRGPLLDAERVATALEALKYKVTRVGETEADQRNLIIKWGAFVNSIEKDDDVIIYYSGHGVSLDGADYIVPIDAPQRGNVPDPATLTKLLNPLSEMIRSLYGKSITSVWILDACRDNPFYDPATKDYGTVAGLGLLQGPGSLGILYAAGYGQQALDRIAADPPDQDVMSLFTRYLVSEIGSKSDRPIHEITDDLKIAVSKASGARDQRPAFYDGLYAVPWCIGTCAPSLVVPVNPHPTTQGSVPTHADSRGGGHGNIQWVFPGDLADFNSGQYASAFARGAASRDPSLNVGSVDGWHQHVFWLPELTGTSGSYHNDSGDDRSANADWGVPVRAGDLANLGSSEYGWAFRTGTLPRKPDVKTGKVEPYVLIPAMSSARSWFNPGETWIVPDEGDGKTGRPTASKEHLQNAVFLGRASASDCDPHTKSFKHPFGCELLKSLVQTNGLGFRGDVVHADEDVSILVSAPSVSEGSDGIHKCVVGLLTAGQPVKISSIVRLGYSTEDTAFWGLLEQPAATCSGG